jgi:hypothetical protein
MSENPSQPTEVNFDYLKSGQFRLVHADGAYIAITQSGLTISFFAERAAIPKRIVHALNPDGTIGQELQDKREVRNAIIRDTEVSVVMTREVAVKVVDAIQDILKRYNDELQKRESK